MISWLKSCFRPRPVARFDDDDQAFEALLQFVMNHEGFRPVAYLCPSKVWTVGYGTTRIEGRAVKQGDRITREEAELIVREDLALRWRTMKKLVKRATPDVLFGWTSCAYNVGTAEVASSKALVAWNDGDLKRAWDEFGGSRGWVKSRGIPLTGLRDRRREEWGYIVGRPR